MYGGDSTQAATLAASGAGFIGLGWNVIAFGVLIMAGLTLFTIAEVIHHRSGKEKK